MTTNQQTTIWLNKHTYWLLPSLEPSQIKDEPGNYIMAKRLDNGTWEALYIGSTPYGGTLQARLPNHEKWESAQRLGATVIWAHTHHNETMMLAEERELIAALNPPLNVQHRTTPDGLVGLGGLRRF